MNDAVHPPLDSPSPWPHRWAVALVCTTFPMIWIGSLVTSYGAGMAVPDWPNTYGYNLFLYPWQTWVFGPFKLFIEHGHRLFGTLVGMVTIGFLISTWWCQQRASWRVLGVLALLGVLGQGVLGGMRVIENKVQLAQVHGIVGPLFFAFTVALALVTSRRWQQAERISSRGLEKIERLAFITLALAVCQLLAGSHLRHLQESMRPGNFRVALFFHLLLALALVAHIGMLSARVLRSWRHEPWLARPAVGLLVLVGLQVCLGAGTWVTKYGFPAWLSDYSFAASYVATADSPLQGSLATAHVAMGAMLLANSLLIALRSARLTARGTEIGNTAARPDTALMMEAVA